MTILNWNTDRGRGATAATGLADQLQADVVLLQEAAALSPWGSDRLLRPVWHGKWGSALLVRVGTLEEVRIAGFEGWVVGGIWTPRQTALFSVHSPTSSDQEPREEYIRESLKIICAVHRAIPADVPLVIGGDFNFKSFGTRAPGEALANTPEELVALQEIRKLGFYAAWRGAHPEGALAQTLRWTRNPATPYHCDGFLFRGFHSKSALCEVFSSEALTEHSDHNPVALWLST